MSSPRAGSAMLACFTSSWIAVSLGCTSASNSAPDNQPVAEWSVCPTVRAAADEAGGCTADDGGNITTVVVPAGCTGASFDGGVAYDRTIFDGQPSLTVGDEDCKYRIQLTRACLPKSRDMGFLVSVTKSADGTPVSGGTPSIVASEGLAHPAPNVPMTNTEVAAGTYAITPVRFDRSGTWTLELHIYEQCPDEPTSPHGHANFEIDVP